MFYQNVWTNNMLHLSWHTIKFHVILVLHQCNGIVTRQFYYKFSCTFFLQCKLSLYRTVWLFLHFTFLSYCCIFPSPRRWFCPNDNCPMCVYFHDYIPNGNVLSESRVKDYVFILLSPCFSNLIICCNMSLRLPSSMWSKELKTTGFTGKWFIKAMFDIFQNVIQNLKLWTYIEWLKQFSHPEKSFSTLFDI